MTSDSGVLVQVGYGFGMYGNVHGGEGGPEGLSQSGVSRGRRVEDIVNDGPDARVRTDKNP